VATQPKTYVCGRSSAEIVGSNTAGGVYVCRLWVLCVARYRSLRRVYHSFRGVLPSVLRRCVWSWILDNKKAVEHGGLLRHGKKNPSNITPRTKVRIAEVKWRRGNVNKSLGQGANARSHRNPMTDGRWAYTKGFKVEILVCIGPIIYMKTNNTQSCPWPLHSGTQGEWKYSSTDSLPPH